jgi:serine/threonine protein kinase
MVDQEIVLLRELQGHPHITEMVDHYVDRRKGKASIYMEYCTREGLESFIEERRRQGEPFNEIDIWQWFIQLFDALAYCHYGPDKDDKYENIAEDLVFSDNWNAV